MSGSGKIRPKINGEGLSLPREMVGKHAATMAAEQLGVTESGNLRLRRVADVTFVGDAAPIGSVLQDGDELELARLPE